MPATASWRTNSMCYSDGIAEGGQPSGIHKGAVLGSGAGEVTCARRSPVSSPVTARVALVINALPDFQNGLGARCVQDMPCQTMIAVPDRAAPNHAVPDNAVPERAAPDHAVPDLADKPRTVAERVYGWASPLQADTGRASCRRWTRRALALRPAAGAVYKHEERMRNSSL